MNKLFLDPINVGDFVMAESKFGTNLGVVLSTSWVSVHAAASAGKVLRIATPEERDAFHKKLVLEEQAVAVCQEVIANKNMDMDILDAEYDWNRDKLAFFFDSKK